MKKALIFCLFALCLSPVNSFGQTETFVKEYVYGLEEEDSQKSARNNAREQLRKMLLTDILGYVRKNYVSSNSGNSGDLSSAGGGSGGGNVGINLYKEAITAHTQDSMKILDEKFDGYEYRMKASITIDMSQITAYIDRRRNEPESVAKVATLQSYNATTVAPSQPQAATPSYSQAGRMGISIQSNLQGIESNLQSGLLSTMDESMQKSMTKQLDEINNSSNSRVVIFLAGTGITMAGTGGTMAGRGLKYKDGPTIGAGFGIAGGGLVLALMADIIRRVQNKHSKEESAQTTIDIQADDSGASGKSSGNGRKFVFSIRPELLLGLSAMSAGGTLELGCIGRSGFYFSMGGNYGASSYGASYNFGGTFNKDGKVKNVLGVTVAGEVINIDVDVNININGNYYSGNHTHINQSMGGVFWKIMFGKRSNFDITNKVLFGDRYTCDNHSLTEYIKNTNSNYFGGYDSPYYTGFDNNGYFNDYDERKFNVTHSLSIGYTFTGGKK